MSLNEWFVEYVYIPLGGNRKGKARKYVNILAVFFASGLWHGAAWHYVAWGMLNGVLAVAGQLTGPVREWFCKKLGVDKDAESVCLARKIIVFWIITLTWVFFQNGISQSLYMIRRMVLFSPVRIFVPGLLLSVCETGAHTFLVLAAVALFCIVQVNRKDERKCYLVFQRQPVMVQIMCLAVLIYFCIFAACAPGVELNTQYLYFQF